MNHLLPDTQFYKRNNITSVMLVLTFGPYWRWGTASRGKVCWFDLFITHQPLIDVPACCTCCFNVQLSMRITWSTWSLETDCKHVEIQPTCRLQKQRQRLSPADGAKFFYWLEENILPDLRTLVQLLLLRNKNDQSGIWNRSQLARSWYPGKQRSWFTAPHPPESICIKQVLWSPSRGVGKVLAADTLIDLLILFIPP